MRSLSPTHGPFDITQGYTLLPVFQERLVENGYTIDKQARQSAKSRSLIEHGIAIPYVKTLSTGLAITDQHGGQIFQASLHAQRFSSFEAIPPLLIQLLLFRENRELFDAERPFLNPAVEWDRFALACLTSLGEQLCGLSEGVGGSTLATQIVKFRHSDE
ncbi:MAG TPA: transglycosylase domain-containing protein, partial [Thermodesulfobacteriota bacterium]|nr:transglycosylase domain-containing protein [Thermodesulfobacteriota bacterium]